MPKKDNKSGSGSNNSDNKRKKRGADKPEEAKQAKPFDSNFWSIILLAFTVFLTLTAFVPGTDGWLNIHNVVRGVFGLSVFLVIPVFFYASYIISKEENKDMIVSRIIQGVLLLLLSSAIIQVVFIGDIPGEDFDAKVTGLYEKGIQMKSGGVLSAVLGVPLVSMLGATGAKLTILLALFVIVLLMKNITVEKLFTSIKDMYGKVKDFWNRMGDDSLRDDYEEEVAAGANYKIEDTAGEIKIDETKRAALPLINKDAAVLEIKNFFKKRFGLDDDPEEEERDEELSQLLDKKSMDLTVEKTNSNTIDIPIVSEKANDEYRKRKKQTEEIEAEQLRKMSEAYGGTDGGIDVTLPETVAPERKPIDLSKKDDEPAQKSSGKATQKPEYRYPLIEFLKAKEISSTAVKAEAEQRETAIKLIQTLENFGVKASLSDVHRGPSVTRYELQPAPGVKVSRFTGLADDIALNLAAAGVRIEAPIPGKPAVGIEVPNTVKDTVTLRELLESEEFRKSESRLSFAVGRDIAGNVIIGDIAKMPHVIIAGSTGSGKSVCTNSIIMSILYKSSPDEVRLLLIDPKIVEFKVYDGIPHLLIPVVTDPRKAAGALNWAVQEMLRRYKLFADNNVKGLKEYNEMAAESGGTVEPIPQIVIAIDELADLMMAAKNEVEDAICRLAQMARAAGMHLIIATQRPTVDIITGLIKANIPSRIALSVKSSIDSRTILDLSGAEKLLGQGDMLYSPAGLPKPIRVQGCFCSTKEIESVVEYIKMDATAKYSDEIMEEIEKNVPVPKGEKPSGGSYDSGYDSDDDLIEKAIDIIFELGQASTSSLQRKLKLGYARAARIMDELEELGVIGPSEGSKPRRILMTKSDWVERRLRRAEETSGGQ
ncbi:DNA translocase FtsK [Ruminococcus sp. HUN007]|uniref:FtsK/SpoIIIE family DNA translocase n=1 Tax=Ruminococcus sp. HUN007 TaxID=1514668 RepID=UPI000679D167|nr:DNA translocase FtsK [Ruminococcus sp. HUN007]